MTRRRATVLHTIPLSIRSIHSWAHNHAPLPWASNCHPSSPRNTFLSPTFHPSRLIQPSQHLHSSPPHAAWTMLPPSPPTSSSSACRIPLAAFSRTFPRLRLQFPLPYGRPTGWRESRHLTPVASDTAGDDLVLNGTTRPFGPRKGQCRWPRGRGASRDMARVDR